LRVNSGFQAESFAAWLNSRAGVNVKVQRPYDFAALAVKVFGTLLLLGTVVLIYSKAGKVSTSKYLWSALSMVLQKPILFLFFSCLPTFSIK
jgi:oligosaccharyltransferase complex subunit gamma